MKMIKNWNNFEIFVLCWQASGIILVDSYSSISLGKTMTYDTLGIYFTKTEKKIILKIIFVDKILVK